jgi:mannosyltransferase
MKKYFDNIIFNLQTSGGGSVYWGEIINYFKYDQSAYFIKPDIETNNIVFNNIFIDQSKIIIEKRIPLNILRFLPSTVDISPDSIFHSSYYRISKKKGVKNVVTIHDFTTEKFGSGISRFVNHQQKTLAVKKSNGIICISEKTKNDLYYFYPDYLKKKHIEVIYNGVSDDFYFISDKEKIKHMYNLIDDKYVLYIGHRTKYKNFDFAIEVVRDLPKNYKLIIIGNPLNEKEYKLLNKIKNKYLYFGNINNNDLNNLYNIAECLLYPSSYEGFGIPLIEAFKCGCPVIAQKLEVFDEISSGSAILINGLDLIQFKNKILELQNESLKIKYREIGFAQSNKFSWNTCLSQVNEFYKLI